MPEGPIGLPRLTSIGPLVESQESGDLLPSFKTKTFTWSKTDFKFSSTGGNLQIREEISSPGGRGVERGSSFSLDGTYIDKVNADTRKAATFVFPLDQQKDIPFFYLNTHGKRHASVGQRDVVLEMPNYFEEAEVAVQQKINPDDAVGVLLTIDEEDVRERKQERIEDIENNEDAEKYGWKDKAIERAKREAEWAIRDIKYIKENFQLLDEIPKTEFRKKVWEIDDKWDGFRRVDIKEQWHEIERDTRPIHKAIAETYGLDYEQVVEMQKQKLRDKGVL